MFEEQVCDLEGKEECQRKTFYHVAPADLADDIKKNGLIPYEPYECPGLTAVFLWDNRDLARRFGESKYGQTPFDEPYTIFEVELPPTIKAEKRRCVGPARRVGFGCEFLVKRKIPIQYIKVKEEY